MIVLDGMPGAGKTTLLRHLSHAARGQVTIFPEAQPPDHPYDSAVAAILLEEATRRIREARLLRMSNPDALVLSDRCHIGVLACRYALAATGQGTGHAFDDALAMCRAMGLTPPSGDVHIIVLILDPERSAARRAAFAHDPRFALWFDQAFLTAYHEFLTSLNVWLGPSPQVTSAEASDDLSWQHLAALFPDSVAERLAILLSQPGKEAR